MLDAALGRAQDRRDGAQRRSVASRSTRRHSRSTRLRSDAGAERSAGLETVACWQTDAQWEPELRDQLDALFADRVLFATASAADARAGPRCHVRVLRSGAAGTSSWRDWPPLMSACTFRAIRHCRWTTPEAATTVDRDDMPLPLDVLDPMARGRTARARGAASCANRRRPLPRSPRRRRRSPAGAPLPPVPASSPPHECPATYGELLTFDAARRVRLLAAAAPTLLGVSRRPTATCSRGSRRRAAR